MDKEYIEESNYEYDVIMFDSGSIKIIQEDNEYTPCEIEKYVAEIFPDQWISDNRNEIITIYNDIQEMADLSTFMDNCDLDEFCDFMDYVNNLNIKPIYDWKNTDLSMYVNKYTYRKNPTFKEYMAHNLLELYDIYCYLMRNYVLKFGPFEVFAEFIYLTSSSNEILK